MSTIEVLIITALVGYAVYKQTKVQLVSSGARFRLAVSYLVVGLVLGPNLPHSLAAAALLAASIIVSVVVGCARGAFTRVWADSDGRVRSRGSLITIGLFLALIASKFVIGTVADRLGIHEASLGEVLVMISVSIAVQAQIVWRRAQRLTRAVGAVHPHGGCRTAHQQVGRADRAGDEVAATVGAAPVQPGIGAVGAERALEGADAGGYRLGR
jgi:hypothetical protein